MSPTYLAVADLIDAVLALVGSKTPYRRFTDQRRRSSGLPPSEAKELLRAAREGRLAGPTRSLDLT